MHNRNALLSQTCAGCCRAAALFALVALVTVVRLRCLRCSRWLPCCGCAACAGCRGAAHRLNMAEGEKSVNALQLWKVIISACVNFCTCRYLWIVTFSSELCLCYYYYVIRATITFPYRFVLLYASISD